MKILAGELNRKITLLEPDSVSGTFGKKKVQPVEHAGVWAKLKHDGGSETTESDAVVALNRVKFFIRYRSDVRSDWGVRDDLGNEYRVAHCYEQNRRDYLVLCCEVRNARP
jgi:SPP1 family predicted phage head-tail adaptor